jgi:lipopolysaccharide biosynthesis regulator YciM
MPGLSWLLLPAAVLGGWLAATRLPGRRGASSAGALSPEYLKGLDYLLNDEPDKAIEVFKGMLDLTADSPDMHPMLADQYLKLGFEFRRRGEVDRAIRIHQELVSRESLGRGQRAEALLALARDYLRAGMLGRAEELFLELLDDRVMARQVLPLLLDIYQQEKDWRNAIRTADRMEQIGDRPASSIIAHYYCEMAESASSQGDDEQARALLAQALAQDSRCARASILLGDLQRTAGRLQEALAAYEQVARQDIERLPLVLDPLRSCHEALGSTGRLAGFLEDVIPRYDGIAPLVLRAELLANEQGPREAAAYLAAHLRRRPSVRGLARLVEFRTLDAGDDEAELLQLLSVLVAELGRDRPSYACRECGFAGRALYWLCPGCRHWDSVRPVHGVEGD